MTSLSRLNSEPSYSLCSSERDNALSTFRAKLTTPSHGHVQSVQLTSPGASNSDRILFNSKFTAQSPGGIILFPQRLQERKGYINYFCRKAFAEKVDRSNPGQTKAYPMLKKTMSIGEAGLILENSQRHLAKLKEVRSYKMKGSMHLGDLWTQKQINQFVKVTELSRIHEAAREVERQPLPGRLEKLERMYEKRQPSSLCTTDVNQIMNEFYNQGINAPTLKLHRRQDAQSINTLNTINTLASIPDEVESLVCLNSAERTDRNKKYDTTDDNTTSRYDTRTTLSDENDNQSTTMFTKSIKEIKGEEDLPEAKAISRRQRSMKQLSMTRLKPPTNFCSTTPSLQDTEASRRFIGGVSPSDSKREHNNYIKIETEPVAMMGATLKKIKFKEDQAKLNINIEKLREKLMLEPGVSTDRTVSMTGLKKVEKIAHLKKNHERFGKASRNLVHKAEVQVESVLMKSNNIPRAVVIKSNTVRTVWKVPNKKL